MRDYAADWIASVNVSDVIIAYLQMFFPVLINGHDAATFVMFSLISLALMFYAVGVAAIRAQHITLLTLALAPALVAVTVSVIWRPVFLWRALIASSPFLYLLIAAALAGSHRRALITYALILPALVIGVMKYETHNLTAKTGEFNIAQMARIINAQWRPGDVIIHGNTGTMMSLWRYTLDKPAYLMPQTIRTPGGLTPRTRAAMGMIEVDIDELQWRRVWLVWSAGELTPPSEDDQVRAIIESHLHEVIFQSTDTFSDSGVWLLYNNALSVGMVR
jgi:hypothetical protein